MRIASGWLDSSVGEVARAGGLARFPYVLISSLDSIHDLARIQLGRDIIARPGCFAVAAGVVVPGASLAETDRAFNLFNGFDSIWCFDAAPRMPPAEVPTLPPPAFDAHPPPELREWMIASGCRLALGDGVGLNYVTVDGKPRPWMDGSST